MLIKYQDMYQKLKGDFPRVTFNNMHGEEFIVGVVPGILDNVFITGDELDWEVIELFNPEFNIFSRQELRALGKALTKLGEQSG